MQISWPLDYLVNLKDMNLLLRLLVENEISRLNVWSNPGNEVSRGLDHINGAEKSLTEVCRAIDGDGGHPD